MSRESCLLLLRPWCHWLLLAIPLLLVAAKGLMVWLPAPLAASLPLVVMFGVLPLCDLLLGREGKVLAAGQGTFLERRLLPLLCIPAQCFVVFWGIGQLADLPLAAALPWLLSMGVIGGIVAINVAHELIHRRSRLDRWAGGLLLALVNYAGFMVEHVRSHHLYVATPKDHSTARLNESVYVFLWRAIVNNPRHAWALERARLRRRGLGCWHWRNELLWWHGVSLLGALICLQLWDSLGLVAYLLQGLLAALTLEVINYIEHYGLLRRTLPDGRYEPPNVLHSWNSDYFLSNAILLQLQRHADHHAHPAKAFPYLEHIPEAPQLPLGYAAMFTLALVPPLWRRIMNPRVQQQRRLLEINNALNV